MAYLSRSMKDGMLTEDQWAVQLFEDVDGVSYRYKVCDHVKVYTEQVIKTQLARYIGKNIRSTARSSTPTLTSDIVEICA